MLPASPVITHTSTREELITAITAVDCGLVILDIDSEDALNTIVGCLEVKQELAIVGVTASSEIDLALNAQRAGCKQITKRPYDREDFMLAVRRAMQETYGEAFNNTTIALMGLTGGAGATTLACHLAIELSAISKTRSLLIDLDLDFGGVARALDLGSEFTIADLVKMDQIDQTALEKSATKTCGNTFVVARPHTIADAHAVDEAGVREVIRLAQSSFSQAIFDLPRKLDPVTGCAIEKCDKLLLVLQLTVPSIDNAKRLLDLLYAEGIPEDRIELVINRFRKNMQACTIDMVRGRLNKTPLATIPSDYLSVHRALDAGVTLEPKNAVRTAIADLAQKLLGQASSEQSGKTWLGKLGIGR